MVRIICSRLKKLQPIYTEMSPPLIVKPAVELCARKVAGTGDLRKAFDLCRQAIEIAEIEYRAKLSRAPLTPSKGDNNADSAATELPKVTVSHAAKVLSTVLGSMNPVVTKIKGMNAQQRLLLCVISLIDSGNSDGTLAISIEPTVAKIYEVYQLSCRERRLLDPVTRSEYFDLINTMETTGIINFAKASGQGSNTPGNRASKKSQPSTPTSGRLNAPGSAKRFGTPTNKSQGLDGNLRIVITADDREVSQGVADLPMLTEFLQDGLPVDLLD